MRSWQSYFLYKASKKMRETPLILVDAQWIMVKYCNQTSISQSWVISFRANRMTRGFFRQISITHYVLKIILKNCSICLLKFQLSSTILFNDSLINIFSQVPYPVDSANFGLNKNDIKPLAMCEFVFKNILKVIQ